MRLKVLEGIQANTAWPQAPPSPLWPPPWKPFIGITAATSHHHRPLVWLAHICRKGSEKRLNCQLVSAQTCLQFILVCLVYLEQTWPGGTRFVELMDGFRTLYFHTTVMKTIVSIIIELRAWWLHNSSLESDCLNLHVCCLSLGELLNFPHTPAYL